MAELDTSQGGGKKHGKGKKRTKKASTRVDLTPMVDLGFLLVTFFMMTTTFSKPQTMEINMPVKPDPKEKVELVDKGVKASDALTIVLSANNEVFWYSGLGDEGMQKTDFSKTGIRSVILQKKLERRERLVILIKATDEATYRNVVDALDEMAICDVKKYALVDIAQVDKDLMKKM